MSSSAAQNAFDPLGAVRQARTKASVAKIFLEFLIIGATSFGGVVPYLRNSLVTKKHWVDDKEFVELLSISQSLPGTQRNERRRPFGRSTTRFSRGRGCDRRRLPPRSGDHAPTGIIYRTHGDHAIVTARLKGVAAAAVGFFFHGCAVGTKIAIATDTTLSSS